MRQRSPKSSPHEDERRARMWIVERECFTAGAARVAGVDEAGRGPLAGPVVVAAVILSPECWLDGLNDSKQVVPEVRERLAAEICAQALAFSIQIIPPEVIDEINILQATHLGMRAALTALVPPPDIALIDGLPLPASPVPQRNLIGGDARSASIAAASILAKVERDRLMIALDTAYPGYGFARHKGYPTPEHLDALCRLGVCPAHRCSFGPVRTQTQQRLALDL